MCMYVCIHTYAYTLNKTQQSTVCMVPHLAVAEIRVDILHHLAILKLSNPAIEAQLLYAYESLSLYVYASMVTVCAEV